MTDVVSIGEVDRTRVADVGGKGAGLGELARIEGVTVPDGVCVTADAFRRFMASAPSLPSLLDRLSAADAGDPGAERELSSRIRAALESTPVPDDVTEALAGALRGLGDDATAYAVRSSATAEDLPGASFAGQQDSFLNVIGEAAVVDHVRRCWLSLFTERAVSYRRHAGFDHRTVAMAVVIQRMVAADAAGVMFTADPVSGNRCIATVEACVGLGEALVAGRVAADVHRVRDGVVIDRSIAEKTEAVRVAPHGGTRREPLGSADGRRPVLTDAQVTDLVGLGRRIEAHLGSPQDIEWCRGDDGFSIVQSRPITTLFPRPENPDRGNHVYVSVGHQQMMTDAFRPLGLSVWQLTTPRPMAEAGSRLFVDVTRMLASPSSRDAVVGVLGRSDPLIGDALRTVVERGDFIGPLPDEDAPPVVGAGPATELDPDPAIVVELIDGIEAELEAIQREIEATSGVATLEFIARDLAARRTSLFASRGLEVIMAGMDASRWLNEHLEEWLGERNVADTLAQSAPHNVTAEMGLALLDVADAVRPHPDVVAFLRDAPDDGVLEALPARAGGREARDAIVAFLGCYGMRCVGEIDITRTRWSERPSTLVPAILANVDNFEPGEAARRLERGRRAAEARAHEVLERVRALPDGESRARETRLMIDRVRTFTGYREYPKYGMVSRYFIYKRALMREATRLVADGVLAAPEDVFFLRLEELGEVMRSGRADPALIQRRRERFAADERLTPPRVMTSEGEAITGSYRRGDLPGGALAGLPVSAGTVEGRARVVGDLADADLHPGDILVTRFTDPSWTPAFLSIAGLVTEVGGLMTHGAVIAREYGLPAVVGVEHATDLIRDGRRIRVHGTDGYVELLADSA